MHPQQSNSFAGMEPLLAVVPTLARTGLLRFLFDPKDGNPVVQARQFIRDVADMPAQMNEASKVTSLGDLPLAVVTAGGGYQPGWLGHQDQLATLSSSTDHRIVSGSTHQSLIDHKTDAAESSEAIRDLIARVRGKRGR
jgi:hypothetical protein